MITKNSAEQPEADPDHSAPGGPVYRDPSHLDQRRERASLRREILAAGALIALVAFVIWGRNWTERPEIANDPSAVLQDDSKANMGDVASDTVTVEPTVEATPQQVTPPVSDSVRPEPPPTPTDSQHSAIPLPRRSLPQQQRS